MPNDEPTNTQAYSERRPRLLIEVSVRVIENDQGSVATARGLTTRTKHPDYRRSERADLVDELGRQARHNAEQLLSEV
jgi:hypothetical protein